MLNQSTTWGKKNRGARVSWITLLYALSALGAVGQATMQPQQQGAGAHVQQLPLSTREQGIITADQRAGRGDGAGVNTVESIVTITGRYQGSLLDTGANVPAISLSFNDAIQRGLRFNLGGATAGNLQAQARGQRLAALSQLLPQVNGLLSQSVSQVYLPAEGISSSTFGGGGSFKVPDTTGQFHFYTLQASFSEDVLDMTALHNLRGAQAQSAAARLNANDARELIVLGVGGTYIQMIASVAIAEAQRRQVILAEATYRQASAQRLAGIRATIDANRSLVELRTEQQRLSSEDAEVSKQMIRLARIVGLSPGTTITLTSKLADVMTPAGSLAEAIIRGQTQRYDLKVAAQQVEAAVQAHKAAHSEYLPTISLRGNYGLQGRSQDVGRVTYNGIASLNLPIWQGGRVKADVAQADAVLSQRKSEYQDQCTQVEAEIRNSYIDLNVAIEQVKVAKENQTLAFETLRQSQDRFTAGVTDSVEVVQSQESLSSANRDYLSSLYAQTLARLHVAQAAGEAEAVFPTLLEGAK